MADSETESEQQMGSAVPERFGLQQNFPNPFNPSTVIRFQLLAASSVSLIIYDLLGRRVRTLLSNAGYSAGHHQLTWDGRDEAGSRLASGVYFYRFAAQSDHLQKNYAETRKLALIQ